METQSPPHHLDKVFNFPDADLTLRSCNNVHFAVHRTVLHLCSSVFADMLSIPQNPSAEHSLSRPIVAMTEDSRALRLLLRFCYPRPVCEEPELGRIKDIKRAATLADKYDIDSLHARVERALIGHDGPPHIAFAVAWRFSYEHAARAIARQSLDVPDF
ncbi:hypothetical protein PENSPDRAFT_589074, partial [Peniophora sp. CONT]